VAGVSAARLLIVNAGSSSLKLRVLDHGDAVIASADLGTAEPWDSGLERFLEAANVEAAVHRVVHGGEEFSEPVLVDDAVRRRLGRLEELAPLHNPPALRMVEAAGRLRPQMPAVICFDTAFHHALPAAASTYALPAHWAQRWPLRRYGFHGLSHAYVSRRAGELAGRPAAGLRAVTAHLGSGASLCAVAEGRSIDTTMGFTPLDGLVMATRSGSVDPGLILWVARHAGLSADQVERALENEAGLLGISGRGGDMAELLSAAAEGDERSALAVEVYLHRLRGSIAAMAAALGGVDLLAFAGGVGENSAEIRRRACEGLGFLGIEIDPDLNAAAEGDSPLEAGGDGARVFRIEAREDLEMARQARPLLG
jgi:acetate kinase